MPRHRPVWAVLGLSFTLAGLGEARGQSAFILGDNPDAKACFEAASSSDGSRTAVERCTQALRSGGLSARDRAATFSNRGVVHQSGGRRAEAVRDYDEAIEIAPDLGAPYVNRGNVRYAQGDYASAVEDYSRAIEVGLPQMALAHYNSGLARLKLGEAEAARADFEMAAELAPDWGAPRRQLQSPRLQGGAAPASKEEV